MITSIEYEALQDFSGLAKVRQSCALRGNGIQITKISSRLKYSAFLDGISPGLEAWKMDFANSTNSTPIIPKLMKSLHTISHQVFKNLSHALELPWEKYLGEMHEFSAPSKDHLRLVKAGDAIPNEWSTLTIIINTASPETALVIYGAALSVFSENITSNLSNLDIAACLEAQGSVSGSGDWLVYYICPNNDVFYTRIAGALMTPLTCEEYESRKRVRDLKVV